jgi:transposase InsO family protein
MAGLLLFGGGWNNHCKRFCGPVMATCLRAESAAGGHDLPEFRMCYGPENISGKLQTWAAKRGIGIFYIQPGKPQQNAYVERYNRTVRQEWLGQFIWNTIKEVKEHATRWLWTYNNERPNMGIGEISPAMSRRQA